MGFMTPGAAWLPSLPMLSMFQCIYFDNRGTGLTDRPEGIYTAEQMADDASNLLKALNLPKARVFGVSMGGMIAQELVLRHPEQVEKVVLGCTLPGGPNSKMAPPEIGQRLMEGVKIMAADLDKGVDSLISLCFPEDFVRTHPEIKDLLREQRSRLPQTSPETADRTMPGLDRAYDRLSQIKCGLIVHGDQDIVPIERAHHQVGSPGRLYIIQVQDMFWLLIR
jgi:pimeloyl-ACP methyl ester carboxylesterase